MIVGEDFTIANDPQSSNQDDWVVILKDPWARVVGRYHDVEITEKGTRLSDDHRHFVFQVLPDATKGEVRAAVEKLFDVKVDSVQVINVRGKMKRTGRLSGKQKNWKKAYVQLKPGHDIDFVGNL